MEYFPERRARVTHREKSSRLLQLETPPLRSLRHGAMEKMKTDGFVKIPRCVGDEVPPVELKVYYYLAGLPSFNKQGAYPSAATIAEKTGLCRNTVTGALLSLTSKGFLKKTKHGKGYKYAPGT